MSERTPAGGRVTRVRFARLACCVGVCLALLGFTATGSEAAHRHHWHGSHSHGTHASHVSHSHVFRSARLSHSWRWQPTRRIVRLTDPEKDAALVLDGDSGRVLYARNADALRHPASLTKMMTLYLLFEQLKNGQMTLATPITLSAHAVYQAPVKLYARPGTTISVDDAIKAIVVLSANDVAVGIAEAVGGTEGHFAEMMTAKAHSWGMTHTYFHNASGLPDDLQITTANDLGILARHVAYDFPQYFHYFSTYSFAWRGATHFTHDNLIGRYEGADGIKTGYTEASGFNLVSSVLRKGVHIIGVVMGGTTARRRDTEMVRLLDDTFSAIGKNPQLVARANVQWQTLAENAQAKPVIAGFQFGTVASAPPVIAVPMAASPRAAAVAKPGVEDEEAAESTPDPAYDPTPVTTKPVATAPKEKMFALAPPPATMPAPTAKTPPPAPPKGAPQPQAAGKITVALLEPAAHPSLPPAASPPGPPNAAPQPQAAGKITVASLEPLARPAPPPAPPPPGAESPAPPAVASKEPLPQPRPKPPVPALAFNEKPSPSTNAVGINWTVQIGAYADATLAQSELAAYAHKSADVLGQAARIVSPLESPEGHTIFRARFGPFDESRARQVCQVLTQRGQTCFAAIASR